jgi:hypothetical protein
MFLSQVFYTGHFSRFEELFLRNGRLENMNNGEPLLQEPTKEIICTLSSAGVTHVVLTYM